MLNKLQILKIWKDQLIYYNEGWDSEEIEKQFIILKALTRLMLKEK